MFRVRVSNEGGTTTISGFDVENLGSGGPTGMSKAASGGKGTDTNPSSPPDKAGTKEGGTEKKEAPVHKKDQPAHAGGSLWTSMRPSIGTPSLELTPSTPDRLARVGTFGPHPQLFLEPQNKDLPPPSPEIFMGSTPPLPGLSSFSRVMEQVNKFYRELPKKALEKLNVKGPIRPPKLPSIPEPPPGGSGFERPPPLAEPQPRSPLPQGALDKVLNVLRLAGRTPILLIPDSLLEKWWNERISGEPPSQ